jgi:hypothetical protein
MTFIEYVEHLRYCLSTVVQLLHQGQTVNQHFYTDVLQHLRVWENACQKWPEKCHTGDWFLHSINAPAHSVLSTPELLARNHTNVISNLLYSPGCYPMWLFSVSPNVTLVLKGNCSEGDNTEHLLNVVNIKEGKSRQFLSHLVYVRVQKLYLLTPYYTSSPSYQ